MKLKIEFKLFILFLNNNRMFLKTVNFIHLILNKVSNMNYNLRCFSEIHRIKKKVRTTNMANTYKMKTYMTSEEDMEKANFGIIKLSIDNNNILNIEKYDFLTLISDSVTFNEKLSFKNVYCIEVKVDNKTSIQSITGVIHTLFLCGYYSSNRLILIENNTIHILYMDNIYNYELLDISNCRKLRIVTKCKLPEKLKIKIIEIYLDKVTETIQIPKSCLDIIIAKNKNQEYIINGRYHSLLNINFQV